LYLLTTADSDITVHCYPVPDPPEPTTVIPDVTTTQDAPDTTTDHGKANLNHTDKQPDPGIVVTSKVPEKELTTSEQSNSSKQRIPSRFFFVQKLMKYKHL